MKKLFLVLTTAMCCWIGANAQTPQQDAANRIANSVNPDRCETKDPNTGYLTTGKMVTTRETTTTTSNNESRSSSWNAGGKVGGEVGASPTSNKVSVGVSGGYNSPSNSNSSGQTKTVERECVPVRE